MGQGRAVEVRAGGLWGLGSFGLGVAVALQLPAFGVVIPARVESPPCELGVSVLTDLGSLLGHPRLERAHHSLYHARISERGR